MSDALARYRMAERQDKDALKRYKDAGAESNTLGALAKYLGLQGYWDRQGRMANEGLQMADQGAQAVQAGNMGGLAGMLLGPAAYIGSPVSALFPERSEVEAATDVPEWSKPWLAGGLETMAIMAPGPKGKGLGKGLVQLADDATDAERAALAGRLETEATQTLPPFTAYHGSPVGGLTVLKPGDRGPFGPATYLSPVEGVAGRYGDNLYQATVNPNEIFNGLGSRYFDGDVNGYQLWRDQVSRVAKASGEKAEEVAAVLGKLDPQDGYRAYHDLRRIMGSDAEAQAVLQRAGFKGVSGHVDGPEIAMFGDVNLGTTSRDQALRNLTEAPEGIIAYHGSPHTFDKFDMSKIGTGEGAQAYGHGLYFAESPEVADSYRVNLAGRTNSPHQYTAADYLKEAGGDRAKAVADLEAKIAARFAGQKPKIGDIGFDTYRKQQDALALLKSGEPFNLNDGSMYQVRINAKPDEFLDWDRPLSEQPKAVRDMFAQPAAKPVDGDIKRIYDKASRQAESNRPEDMALIIDNDSALHEAAVAWAKKNVSPARVKLMLDKGESFGHAIMQVDPAYHKAVTRKYVSGEELLSTELDALAKRDPGARVAATEKLKAAGIKGIRYKDAGSRGGEGGTYNYVVFDDKIIDILKRYGIPMTAGVGGAMVVTGANMPPEIAAQMGPQA